MPVRDDMPMGIRKKYRVPDELYTRRNNRCSPSWSFRCDNRTHIEDFVDNTAWLSHDHGGVIVPEFSTAENTEIEGLSEGSSSSGVFQTPKWQKFSSQSSIPGKAGTGAAGKMI